MRWAALLKGVNVGGNRKVPMADLRAMLTGMGFADAATLLASGNAVFDADQTDAAKLERALETEAQRVLGLTTDFLVRSREDLDAVIAGNPFPDAAKERPSSLVVVFHREPFDPALIDALAAAYSGPERLHASGRELYIDFPDGQGRSELHPVMAKRKFPKLATGRNWNTVVKIAALMGQ